MFETPREISYAIIPAAMTSNTIFETSKTTFDVSELPFDASKTAFETSDDVFDVSADSFDASKAPFETSENHSVEHDFAMLLKNDIQSEHHRACS